MHYIVVRMPPFVRWCIAARNAIRLAVNGSHVPLHGIDCCDLRNNTDTTHAMMHGIQINIL